MQNHFWIIGCHLKRGYQILLLMGEITNQDHFPSFLINHEHMPTLSMAWCEGQLRRCLSPDDTAPTFIAE